MDEISHDPTGHRVLPQTRRGCVYVAEPHKAAAPENLAVIAIRPSFACHLEIVHVIFKNNHLLKSAVEHFLEKNGSSACSSNSAIMRIDSNE